MVNKIVRYAIHSPNCKLVNKMPGVIDLTHEAPEVYSNFRFNEHHWTTNYVWNTFIPRLSNDLSLRFNPDEFVYITHVTDGHDLSYHIPVSDEVVIVNDLFYDTTTTMRISETAFNKDFKSYLGCFTDYHKLFICSHRCARISNTNSVTDRNLLLNTDSMSVPLMLYLMHNFKNILILDNRTERSYATRIDEFCKHSNLTYMELFIADSYNMHKYATNIK